MGKPLLLLRLEGPLQSWGVRSRWDVRDTGLEPTKSGVIGLIGCALGLHRRDPELERLDRDLVFGVRIDRPGIVSTDYQTVTGYHRTAAGEYKHSGGTAKSLSKAMEHGESTVVSPHDYLLDASFLVALSSHDDSLLRQLAGDAPHPKWAGHLQHPVWPLYLGRKSCVPTRRVFDKLTELYDDTPSAFKEEPWPTRDSKEKHPTQLLAWLEDPDGQFERQDAIRVNQLRSYDFRSCRRVEIHLTAEP